MRLRMGEENIRRMIGTVRKHVENTPPPVRIDDRYGHHEATMAVYRTGRIKDEYCRTAEIYAESRRGRSSSSKSKKTTDRQCADCRELLMGCVAVAPPLCECGSVFLLAGRTEPEATRERKFLSAVAQEPIYLIERDLLAVVQAERL
jgi:hypothetical protein